MTSSADASFKGIAIGAAPFISFSLRSVAIACLQVGAVPPLACTVLMVGTKVGAIPNATSTNDQVTTRVMVAGADSGGAQKMTRVRLDSGGGRGEWTGLESVSFVAEIDGKPAGLGVDDLEYDLKTKGCYFDAE